MPGRGWGGWGAAPAPRGPRASRSSDPLFSLRSLQLAHNPSPVGGGDSDDGGVSTVLLGPLGPQTGAWGSDGAQSALLKV